MTYRGSAALRANHSVRELTSYGFSSAALGVAAVQAGLATIQNHYRLGVALITQARVRWEA